jgi:hypothetical protein
MGTINFLSASCERQALDLNEKAVFLNLKLLNFLLNQIVDILNVMFIRSRQKGYGAHF